MCIHEGYTKMTDIFDETIMCSKCSKKMDKVTVVRNGFSLRALECKKCGKYIYHPNDIEEYKKFQELRQRPFAVKLRMVGNSYTVSIPREIIDFQEQMFHEMEKQIERMTQMVRIGLEEPGRLSLTFKEEEEDEEEEEK